ncbi:glutathione S-transferase family protein [Stenotrophobium rhamnosiphilum]|uniref:Glutathione S-transferase n=1 Tax=Stenotrophobium rhamnosiphilum TaxID=2029166 RepID=A0A2T5ME71_9GAMM|nr:glutathione S-transferase family protein [Stenotrophobium rhamnosiphilum]PTU30880.1 glutathione S-transferase [Stenotrophobium rhamnosiphilum]
MSEAIVLHQWEISPFCQKVARVLKHKGLAYESINYNGVLGAKVGRLSKVGKVPVLDIDGHRIQDSTRIARYLDEHYPESPLYPLDPQQRAQAELWEDWSDELLYWFEVYFRLKDPVAIDQAVRIACEGRSAVERLPIKLTLKAGLGLQLFSQGLGRMQREDVESDFLRHLDRIETVLENSGWLVGEAISIADIAVGSQLIEVDRTSARMRPELQNRPRLSAWMEKVKSI